MGKSEKTKSRALAHPQMINSDLLINKKNWNQIVNSWKNGKLPHALLFHGPPGSGKSSITNQLIKKYRQENKSVCALLVDPSSPFTKGAVLGDRISMKGFEDDSKDFIRSIASSGSKGGLSKNIHYISDLDHLYTSNPYFIQILYL